MADIKEILKKNIQKNASADQKPYGTLQQDLKSINVNHECSKIAFDAMQKILGGASEDTLGGLKIRLERIKQLETYIRGSKVGSEEEGILLSTLAKVKTAISQHLAQKRSFMAKAAQAISNSSVDVGGTLIAMSKNDPLMKMLVSGGGAASKLLKNATSKYMNQRKAQQQALYDDAVKMYNTPEPRPPKIEQPKESKEPEQPKESEPPKEPEQPKTKKPKKTKQTNQPKDSEPPKEPEQPKKPEQPKAPDVEKERSEKLYALVQNIDQTVLRLAETTESLLEIAQREEIRNENLAFDQQEAASENRQGDLTKASGNPDQSEKKDGKGILSKLLSGGGAMLGGLLSSGGAMLGGAAGALGLGGILSKLLPMTKILGAIVGPLADGILGYFKAGEWGVSGISAFLGGMLGGTFSNKILNVVANMGKWAVLGATLGSVVPGPGNIIGGVIGALIGGVLGYFGGEKIAKFIDNIGGIIQQAFDAVINWGTELYNWVSSAVSDMWSFMTTATEPYLEQFKQGISWVGEQLSVILDPIKETLTEVFKWMSEIGEKFWDWIKGLAPDWAKDGLAKAGELGSKAYDLAAGAAGSVADTASSAWEGTKGAASSAYGVVTDWWGGKGTSSGQSASGSLQQAPTSGMAAGEFNKPMQGGNLNTVQQGLVGDLKSQGITDPRAIANIMAQIQAESNFKPQNENLNYSAKTLLKKFGPGSGNKVRVRSLEEAQAIVDKGPEAIGNLIYGGRMGNAGNEGFKYRGRGLVQLTGKERYVEMSKKLGVDLVNNPDLANDPQIASKIAAHYYAERKNKFNYSDVNQVSKATGHAGGKEENQKRAEFADKWYATLQQNPGSLETSKQPMQLASVAVPVSNNVAQAAVNSKSAEQTRPITVINNNVANNSVSSVKGNQGGSQGSSYGTSGRRPSQVAATFGK
jgi:predicted chitinase